MWPALRPRRTSSRTLRLRVLLICVVLFWFGTGLRPRRRTRLAFFVCGLGRGLGLCLPFTIAMHAAQSKRPFRACRARLTQAFTQATHRRTAYADHCFFENMRAFSAGRNRRCRSLGSDAADASSWRRQWMTVQTSGSISGDLCRILARAARCLHLGLLHLGRRDGLLEGL